MPGVEPGRAMELGPAWLSRENRPMANETHLILPVPAAEPPVAEHRELLDPVASQGVPAHITILSPFLELDAITPDDLGLLTQLFAATATFEFALTRVERFPHALYLAPEPAQPFVELTNAVWRHWPNQPPFGGAHRDVIPHLTVALGEGDFAEVRRTLQPRLPISAAALEVWLIARRDEISWTAVERFPIGGT